MPWWTSAVVILSCLTSVVISVEKRGSGSVDSYLMQFGYLPQSNLETGNSITEDAFRTAIKSLQAYGNIPQTGQIDSRTKELMKKPRCGVPDLDEYLDQEERGRRSKRYTLHPYKKWEKTSITWSLENNPIRNKHLSHDDILRALTKAMKVWEQDTNLRMSRTSREGDIKVSFFRSYHGDGYKFDGNGKVLAHAFFPGPQRGGDIHFDDDEHWDTKADGKYSTSLYSVAAHEIGHSLGLRHSSVEGSLMFPWYQELKETNYRLPKDDKNGIHSLYGIPRNYRPTLITYPPRTRPPSPPTAAPPRRGGGDGGPRRRPAGRPDPCNTHYDAIAMIRSELYIFIGKYLWRFGAYGVIGPEGSEISRYWSGLPRDFSHVDAVLSSDDKDIIMIFIGQYMYPFKARSADRSTFGATKVPLTRLGLPHDLKKVDAAMEWGHNGKIYIFAETLYWRLDWSTKRVEPDYPRDSMMWRGVPYNIDAVFKYSDGKTFFFKDRGYYQFDDLRMRTRNTYPLVSSTYWMGCPNFQRHPGQQHQRLKSQNHQSAPKEEPEEEEDEEESTSSASVVKHTWTLLLTMAMIVLDQR